MNPVIPCTILTGILGAGKTTLLNAILKNSAGMKLGVVVNEFGQIDVDGKLVQMADGPQLNLNNGCICCTIRGDLEESVLGLLQRNPDLEGLILEASGVADPQPVANTFILSGLRQLTRVDSVIAVVDLAAYPRLRGKNAMLARRQVASADLVLLNKRDLVSSQQCEAVQASLRDWVSDLRLLECSQAQVPMDLLLGERRFRAAQLPAGPPVSVHLHQSGHSCAGNHSGDEFVLQTWTFEEPGKFRARALTTALKTLPIGCYRAKGFVRFQEEGEETFQVQLCGTRLDVRPVHFEPSSEEFLNQIVFLAEPGAIDESALAGDLQEALQVREDLSPSQELLKQVARVLGDPESL